MGKFKATNNIEGEVKMNLKDRAMTLAVIQAEIEFNNYMKGLKDSEHWYARDFFKYYKKSLSEGVTDGRLQYIRDRFTADCEANKITKEQLNKILYIVDFNYSKNYSEKVDSYFVQAFLSEKTLKEKLNFIKKVATEVYAVLILGHYLETYVSIYEIDFWVPRLMDGYAGVMEELYCDIDEEKEKAIKDSIKRFQKHAREFGLDIKQAASIVEAIIAEVGVNNFGNIPDKAIKKAQSIVEKAEIEVLSVCCSLISKPSAYITAAMSVKEIKEAIWDNNFEVLRKGVRK